MADGWDALSRFGAELQGRGLEYQQMQQKQQMQDALGKYGQQLSAGQITPQQYLGAISQYDPTVARDMAMQQAGVNQPAALQEWAAFQKMSPEEKNAYLGMKRAQQVVNLGGTQAVLSPTGGISEEYGVTLKPENLPENAQAKAEATAIGAAQGAAVGEKNKKSKQASNMVDLVGEAEQLLPSATSGLLEAGAKSIQQAAGVSTESSKADARLKVISAGLVSNVPRMEGPQSDKDTKMYKEAAGNIGDTTIPYEDRLAALETIKTIQQKYVNTAQQPSAVKRVNFQDYMKGK